MEGFVKRCGREVGGEGIRSPIVIFPRQTRYAPVMRATMFQFAVFSTERRREV